MSALSGWVDFEGESSNKEPLLLAMMAAMRGRGSDGQTVWLSTEAVLGHCYRIVGRGDAGRELWVQALPGSLIAVTCTGRIYNAAELETQLNCRPASPSARSSAEIIGLAYRKWGGQFVERLNGMFAFAIWDQKTRALLLGRDHLGLQPLYYHLYDRGVLFASLPQAILSHPRFEARLDTAALPVLLQPRLALPGETWLRDLRELPAAHVLLVQECGGALHRYWRLRSEPHPHTFQQTVTHVRELLEDIVDKQMHGVSHCGAMLSGGVDSTSVAALAAKTRRRRGSSSELETFCIEFKGDGGPFVASELRPEIDAPFAALAAVHLGTRHHTLSLRVADLWVVIPATRVARGLPGWGQFDASMFVLFQNILGRCPVAFTGEGADELFGGYPYYFKHEFISRPSFPWLGDGPKLTDYLATGVVGLDPMEDERERYVQWLAEVPKLPGEESAAARMREVQFLGMAGPLAVVLDREERMSMAQGLEVRVPFCDYRLVQYMWNVPWEMKCHGGVKGLLKAAFRDLLPDSTLSRRKSAYPHIQDTAYASALIQESREIVNDRASAVATLFDCDRLSKFVDDIEAHAISASMLPGGIDPAYLLIQLVEMHHWMRDYRIAI